ncbi:glycosyltransferase [Zooshikella marina]|uniref:glycosyltransferase n=1 Tax=Zooshikella ganghwensis TaxID=202772 RepID=UPI001BAE5C23|nr:glycosyltransferase [Zooshikella ganghwensis]MBU2706244.1 glycosyltransferase [Zooshikella ganghwensis]
MYVLQLCHDYKPPFLSVANQYAALFDDTPFKVVTVYLKGEPKEEVIKASKSSDVIFLNYSSKQLRGLKRQQIADLKKLHKKFNFKFVLAHRYKALFIASHISNVPCVGIHHAFGDYQRLTRRWYVNKHRQRLFLLGVSDAVRDDMRGCLTKWNPSNIQTLYNRVDYDLLKSRLIDRESARKKLGLPLDKFVYANVGRLHPDKDQATLIKAFAQVIQKQPNSLLAIMGSGRLQSELEELTKTLGIMDSVLFLGQVKEAARYFTAFDSFVLSSDHEPFGMVLLEAMVAGLPIISTDCGGAKEVVSGCGALFTLGDDKALVKKMLEVHHYDSVMMNQLVDSMDRKVTKNFSYAAVKNCFWQIPFVQQISGV